MPTLTTIAEAILRNEPLEVRSLYQDFERAGMDLDLAPATVSGDVLAVAAGLAELIAHRKNRPVPAWTSSIGKVVTPIYLVKAAAKSPKMKARVKRESPEPFRKRGIYAPPGYLELV